jgi:hypothetical protein
MIPLVLDPLAGGNHLLGGHVPFVVVLVVVRAVRRDAIVRTNDVAALITRLPLSSYS